MSIRDTNTLGVLRALCRRHRDCVISTVKNFQWGIFSTVSSISIVSVYKLFVLCNLFPTVTTFSKSCIGKNYFLHSLHHFVSGEIQDYLLEMALDQIPFTIYALEFDMIGCTPQDITIREGMSDRFMNAPARSSRLCCKTTVIQIQMQP